MVRKCSVDAHTDTGFYNSAGLIGTAGKMALQAEVLDAKTGDLGVIIRIHVVGGENQLPNLPCCLYRSTMMCILVDVYKLIN